MGTATLTVDELHALLKPVIPLAASDDMPPVIAAVHIKAHGDYLTAAATDRFRAGIQRIRPADGVSDDFEALVNINDAKRLLAIHKPVRGKDSLPVTLSVDDGVLWSESTGGFGFDLGSARLGMRLVLGKFPNLASLFTAPIDSVDDPGDLLLDIALLSGFKAAAEVNRGDDRAPGLIMRKAGPNKPVMIHAGEDFVGLIMQRKLDGKSGCPADWVDSWRDHFGMKPVDRREKASA